MIAAGQVGTESSVGAGRWMDGGEMGGKFRAREGLEEMKSGSLSVRLPLSLMGNRLHRRLRACGGRKLK